MDLHILFEDNHLLVLKKDFSVKLSDLDKKVESYFQQKKGKIGFLKRLFDLNNLASGIIVYVLTSKAFERMQNAEISFKFLSVTVGKPAQAFGYFSANVEKLDGDKLGIAPLIKNSYLISFYYKLLATNSKISLVETLIGSADANAVRFGLAEVKSPVFGDKIYGGDCLAENTNLALLLFEVGFEHPTTHNRMLFRCSPIEDTKPWAYFDLNKLYKI